MQHHHSSSSSSPLLYHITVDNLPLSLCRASPFYLCLRTAQPEIMIVLNPHLKISSFQSFVLLPPCKPSRWLLLLSFCYPHFSTPSTLITLSSSPLLCTAFCCRWMTHSFKLIKLHHFVVTPVPLSFRDIESALILRLLPIILLLHSNPPPALYFQHKS